MIRRLLSAIGLGARDTADGARGPFAAGDLVSVETDRGEYGVMKILATDARGVHARLYVQRFARRPRPEDVGELSTAPFGPGHDHPFSIGHMPLSHLTFARWQP